MMSGTSAAIPARTGARSAMIAARDALTVTVELSVLVTAYPSPGKCLRVGATRSAMSPRANEIARTVTVAGV